jgi:hypothetical protein
VPVAVAFPPGSSIRRRKAGPRPTPSQRNATTTAANTSANDTR